MIHYYADYVAIFVGLLSISAVGIGFYISKLHDRRMHLHHRLTALTSLNKVAQQPVKRPNFFQLRREDILQKRIKRYVRETTYKNFSFQHLFYKAGITFPVYYVMVVFGTTIVGIAIALHNFVYVDTGNAIGISFFLNSIFYWLLIDHMIERRKRELIVLLPQALDIIIRGLKAGFSVERTFTTVANEIQDPVGREFKIICEQIALGVIFEDAIRNAADRIQDADFDFFITAMVIQRRIGGSLADLMVNIAIVLRKREDLKLKIKSLSAEAKATGLIVGILPFIATILMSYQSPGYLNIFLVDPMGKKLLYAVFGMIIAAVVIVKRLIKFDI